VTGVTSGSERLRAELAARVDGEVRFDAGSRAAYAHDGSNYRQVPIGSAAVGGCLSPSLVARWGQVAMLASRVFLTGGRR
jgi:hypothetical protein